MSTSKLVNNLKNAAKDETAWCIPRQSLRRKLETNTGKKETQKMQKGNCPKGREKRFL